MAQPSEELSRFMNPAAEVGDGTTSWDAMAARARGYVSSRAAPAVVGVVTALITWWVWGSLRQIPVYHDESAFLLQADLFASGRWTAPGPPLPEFFEQFHVIVTPIFAAKYWPGHALLMVPGVWLGLPGLVPVLLSGLTGALCFALARRVAGPWVAAGTWFFWATAPREVFFRASYFSEVTTGALWLLGWWALLDWYETGRRGALLTIAACVGWSAITRPLTAVAYVIPVAVVVLRRSYARRSWWDLGLAAALGAVIVGVIPLWNARTTGDWRLTPYALYARQYFNFGMPGSFGLDTTARTAPERSLPPDMERFDAEQREMVRAHTVAALPRNLIERLQQIGDDMWHGWRVVFLPLAALGLVALSAAGVYAVASAALLIVVHLAFPHPPFWSLYYYELQPVLAFLTAVGVGVAASRVAKWPGNVRVGRAAAVVACGAAFLLAARDLVALDRGLARRRDYARGFLAVVRRIPEPKAIVFVHYAPDHYIHRSLIVNQPDWERTHTWIVYDRGPDNARLMALAPDRSPYLFDEATGTLTRLSSRVSPP
jgi:hypothetical protein